jgi:prepilin-type N-terminal cleavage/methylation domain-containing protein
MQGNHLARCQAPADRRGFSLIELLVVIAIIGILVALTAGVAIRVMGGQSASNTRVLLRRSKSRLAAQQAYVLDLARRYPPNQNANPDVWKMASNQSDRALVIHSKFLFAQWFPTTFAEAVNGPTPKVSGAAGGYPAIQGYVTYLAQFGITPTTNPPGTPPQAYEGAVCLNMILQHGPETAGAADLGLSSQVKEFSGLPALVDGWGNPLVFCRWPTGDLQPAGKGGTGASPVNLSGAQAGVFLDPLDPKGTLTANAWLNSTAKQKYPNFQPSGQFTFRQMYEGFLHPLPNRTPNTARGKPTSLNLASVIVSSGAGDNPQLTRLGLFAPPSAGGITSPQFTTLQQIPTTATTGNNPDANDNLYSTLLP